MPKEREVTFDFDQTQIKGLSDELEAAGAAVESGIERHIMNEMLGRGVSAFKGAVEKGPAMVLAALTGKPEAEQPEDSSEETQEDQG